jgi:hypothetical protein
MTISQLIEDIEAKSKAAEAYSPLDVFGISKQNVRTNLGCSEFRRIDVKDCILSAHIASCSPDRILRLIAYTRRLKELLREVPGPPEGLNWTDHPAISFHEVQIDKDWFKERDAALAETQEET